MRCSRCGRDAPVGTEPSADPREWGAGKCPACRADVNARAAATAGRIASGLAQQYAASWGLGAAVATVRALPSMAVRSTWALGGAAAMHPSEAAGLWAELGDGAYLFTVELGGERRHAAVDVFDGEVDVEPVTEGEVAQLAQLGTRAAG